MHTECDCLPGDRMHLHPVHCMFKVFAGVHCIPFPSYAQHHCGAFCHTFSLWCTIMCTCWCRVPEARSIMEHRLCIARHIRESACGHHNVRYIGLKPQSPVHSATADPGVQPMGFSEWCQVSSVSKLDIVGRAYATVVQQPHVA